MLLGGRERCVPWSTWQRETEDEISGREAERREERAEQLIAWCVAERKNTGLANWSRSAPRWMDPASRAQSRQLATGHTATTYPTASALHWCQPPHWGRKVEMWIRVKLPRGAQTPNNRYRRATKLDLSFILFFLFCEIIPFVLFF